VTLLQSEEERKGLTRRIKWLLFLRVVVLSFFLGATFFVYLFRGELSFRSLQFPLIAAYVISLFSALILPRIKNLVWFSHAQLSLDVLLVTGIILITGDARSPFPFLYNLAVLNGSILLFYRGAFLTAGFSSACYGGLLLWTRFQESPLLPVEEPFLMGLVNIPAFFIIAFLGGYLSSRVHQTEKLLAEKERNYQDLEALKEALIQGVGSGIAVTDVKGVINYFNNRAQELTAISGHAVEGKSLGQIFPALSFNFDGPIQSQRTAVDEFSYTDPQGREKHLRLTLAPLSDPVAGPVGFVSIFDDITKEKETQEKLRLEEEMRKGRERELEERLRAPEGEDFRFEGVMGRGGGMTKIYQLIQKVTATNSNVLITGESGTGKEVVARAIHANGPRRDCPFVPVNCGAIPENLMESELFGHVRGAFTGAVADHAGFFKQADHGTIFLDEVGELPLHLQVKLLRILQEKTFTPVGGNKPITVDVRVISASNKDLRKEMEKAQFREDLFYRLNVVLIALPPLRNRKEDIPLLAQYVIRKVAKGHHRDVEEMSSEALMHLMNYSYPGNIRELENIIEHAVAVTNKNILTEEDIPAHVKAVKGKHKGGIGGQIASWDVVPTNLRGTLMEDELTAIGQTAPGDSASGDLVSLDDVLAIHEKSLLVGALQKADGVQKKAAELLGINYRSFRHRLEKYGMLQNRESKELDGDKYGQKID
jgi:two-component system response regulator PilR (NtrC family)